MTKMPESPNGRDKPFVGWKVFLRDKAGRLAFEYYAHRDKKFVPRGRWLRSRREPGFHLFRHRRQAERWRDAGKVIRRVYAARVEFEGVMHVMIGSQQTETYPSMVCCRWLFVPAARGGRR